jgi:parallel beta-helix repeat protein
MALVSCGPGDDIGGQTPCDGAVARASYTWQASYYPSRTESDRPNRPRQETFGSSELLTRNGIKPLEAASGPDDEGVWWPEMPPRPTADELDRRRGDFEANNSPQLARKRDFFLECEVGNLTASGQVYRQVARAIQDGQSVMVNYGLGRALKANIQTGERTVPLADTESGEAGTAPATPGNASPQTQPSPQVPDNRQGAAVGGEIPNSTPVTLYVNPEKGNDRGKGTDREPFQTISTAIAKAKAGDTIQLSRGTYSSESGERFPLQLISGVTLQGDERSRGQGIQIRGGGDFISPTWAKQSVAIVAADGAKVVGLTLSNPNLRGTAVWVEAGSAAIASNTFTDNHREGVFASGYAAPELRNNLFEANGGNGISFTRDSSGLMAGNVIRSNGYGIAVSERANPMLMDNEIANNRFGVVISGEARPTLQENVISNHAEDGVVVVEASQPTLVKNQLRQNARFDINKQSDSPIRMEQAELAGIKVQSAPPQTQYSGWQDAGVVKPIGRNSNG